MPDYIFKHLYVPDSENAVIFLGYRLNLTASELKIIQIIAEKERVGTDEICRGFEKPLTRGNVAVHICAVNRKAARVSGRKLIEYKNKCYYFNDFM